jgi:hypothetical protein
MERAGPGTNEGTEIAQLDSVNPRGWLTPHTSPCTFVDRKPIRLLTCARRSTKGLMWFPAIRPSNRRSVPR